MLRITPEHRVAFGARRTDTSNFVVVNVTVCLVSARIEARIETATVLAEWLTEGAFLIRIAFRFATFVWVTTVVLQ